MNIAILQGRPVADPELKKSNRDGKIFTKFRLCCERPYKGKDVYRPKDYFDVIVFGKLGQAVYNNLAKGALCTVLGRIEHRKYQNAAGESRDGYSVIASNVTIHEWLRKHNASFDDDVDELVPKEISNSLYRQVDFADEDMPDDWRLEND